MVNTPRHFDDRLDAVDFDDDFMDRPAQKGQPDSKVRSYRGVLEFMGKKYATGLTWLSGSNLDDQTSSIKKGRSLSADFICDRSYASQSGYGYLNSGHKSGMPSIAAIAADALVGEWHGVFEADNGWLYVAVHADNIAPDGDLFFHSEQEAYNHFLAESEGFKWPKTYVPQSWNIPASDGEIRLEKIVEDISLTSLRPITMDAIFYGRANKILFFTLCIVGLIVAISYFLIRPLVPVTPEKADVAVTVPDETLFQVPMRDILPGEQAPSQATRLTLPDPEMILDNCANTVGSLIYPIPGWTLITVRCNETATEAVWQKALGDLKMLRAYVDATVPQDISRTYSSESQFILSKSSALPDNNIKPVTFDMRDNILFSLNDSFSRLGAVQVKDMPAVVTPTPDQISQNPDSFGINIYPYIDFVLVTKLSPDSLKGKFNLQGLKFNMIEWSVPTSEWRYNTAIYYNDNMVQQTGLAQ